jgi:tetratricopeptide (TPR) repeat protein
LAVPKTVRYFFVLFALCLIELGAASRAFGQGQAPGPTQGQSTVEPAPAGETAATHLQRSVRHFQNKEFLQAAEELQTAYAIEPKPLLLFNIGQAYRRAGRPQEALAAYERFVREDPTSTLRPETEGYCNDMRTLIAEQERKAQVEKALVNEQQRAQKQAAALADEQERGRSTQQALTLERQRNERERRRPLYRRPWFWGVLGAAVVAVGTSVALGVTLAPRDRPTDGGFVEVNF